jgi:exodeoxyribonuclease VIII
MGVHQIDFETYQNLEGVNHHFLEYLRKSPAHAKYYKENKKIETSSMIFGKIIHSAVLEPNIEMIIEPEINKRTKEGKELYQKFLSENIGKIIISDETFQIIKNI